MTAAPLTGVIFAAMVVITGCSEATPGVADMNNLDVITDPPGGFVETYRGEMPSIEDRGPSGVVYLFDAEGGGEPDPIESAAAIAARRPWRLNEITCPEERLDSELGYGVLLGAEIDGNTYTMVVDRSSTSDEVSVLVRGRPGESPWTSVTVRCSSLDRVPLELADATETSGPAELRPSAG